MFLTHYMPGDRPRVEKIGTDWMVWHSTVYRGIIEVRVKRFHTWKHAMVFAFEESLRIDLALCDNSSLHDKMLYLYYNASLDYFGWH